MRASKHFSVRRSACSALALAMLAALSRPALGDLRLSLPGDRPVSAPASDVRSIFDLLPDDIAICVTIHDGARHVAALKESPLLKRLLENEAVAALLQQPDLLKAQGGLLLFAGTARLDPWGAVGHMTGKELAIGLRPRRGEKPDVIAVLRADQPEAVARMFDALLATVGLKPGEAAGEDGQKRSKVVAGVRGYQLNPEAFAALDGEFLYFSNRAEVLQSVIEQRHDASGKLSARPAFLAARGSVPPGALLSAYFDLERIRAAAGESFARTVDNFIGLMVAGDILQSLRTGDWAMLSLAASKTGLEIEGRVSQPRGPDERVAKSFRIDPAGEVDWSRLDLGNLLGQWSIARDWRGIWELREPLLTPDGLRGFTELAGNLTTLLGGLDFASDLLPDLKSPLHFIAVRQKWTGSAPSPELPGLALILQLKHPEKLGPRLDSGALMLVSLLNFEGGKKMGPQYQISMETYDNTRITVARYPETGEPGPRGIRYNFEPCFATIADHFIVTTSANLMHDLIDALGKLPKCPAATGKPAADAIQIRMHELAALLRANREPIIADRMLKEDLERDVVSVQVDSALAVAELFDTIGLRVQPVKNGLELHIRIDFAR